MCLDFKNALISHIYRPKVVKITCPNCKKVTEHGEAELLYWPFAPYCSQKCKDESGTPEKYSWSNK